MWHPQSAKLSFILNMLCYVRRLQNVVMLVLIIIIIRKDEKDLKACSTIFSLEAGGGEVLLEF